MEKDSSNVQPATPRRKITSSTVEGRVFEKGSTNGQPTAFQRKLVAARERGMTLKETKNNEGPTPQNLETIRQWQKHYRKVFPEYTFYFESVPEDLKARFSRQIANLGAVCSALFSICCHPSLYARLVVFQTTAIGPAISLNYADRNIARREVLLQICHSHSHNALDSSRD